MAPRWVKIDPTEKMVDGERIGLPWVLASMLSNRDVGWDEIPEEVLRGVEKERLKPLEPYLAAAEGLPRVRHLIVLPSASMQRVPLAALNVRNSSNV